MPETAGLIARFPTAGGSAVDVRPNPKSARNIVAGCHGCQTANGSTAGDATERMRDWAQSHAANCRA